MIEFEKFKPERLPIQRIKIPWLRSCTQKILIVTDGYPGIFLNGSFSHYYFGLSALIDTLTDQNDYYVKFQLTLAHRQTDTQKPNVPVNDPQYQRYGPNYENFRFTTNANDIKTGKSFDIDYFDQVWLFGVRGNENDVDRLTDQELRILTDWMEAGGGLFATGDHADLGASLCSRVPRASKMRMWTDIRNSAGTVIKSPPSPTGLNRHDTLNKGHDAVYTFDDESDDIPMRISPKFYYSWHWHPFYRNKHPHPVLCGKRGVIDVLPDHPHEGEIIEESQVDITDNLYNGDPEFPKRGTLNFRPEVIAHAHVMSDHTNASDTNKFAANAKTFGAIGAYDGYVTNVGRVIVDSTWHHWMDVNLIGRPVANLNTPPFDNTNPKTQGFLATAAGRAQYYRIQNYFLNVGLWLAPKTDRLCLLRGLIWGYVVQYPAVERLRPDLSILELGVTAKDAIGKIAGQCNLRDWLFTVYPLEIQKVFQRFNGEIPERSLTLPPEDLLEIYALGVVTRNFLNLAYELQDKNVDDEKIINELDSNLNNIFVDGLNSGIEMMVDELGKNFTASRRKVNSLVKTDIKKSIQSRFLK